MEEEIIACHITEHAWRLVIGLGKSNVWRDVFQYVYYAFENFVVQACDNETPAVCVPV